MRYLFTALLSFLFLAVMPALSSDTSASGPESKPVYSVGADLGDLGVKVSPTHIVSLDASESGVHFPIEVLVPGYSPGAAIYHNPFTYNLWQSSDDLGGRDLSVKGESVASTVGGSK